jgi:hypothetical protein
MHLLMVTPEDAVNLDQLVHARWETVGANADGTKRRKLHLYFSAPEAVGVADTDWSTAAYSVVLADEMARDAWAYIASLAHMPHERPR